MLTSDIMKTIQKHYILTTIKAPDTAHDVPNTLLHANAKKHTARAETHSCEVFIVACLSCSGTWLLLAGDVSKLQQRQEYGLHYNNTISLHSRKGKATLYLRQRPPMLGKHRPACRCNAVALHHGCCRVEPLVTGPNKDCCSLNCYSSRRFACLNPSLTV